MKARRRLRSPAADNERGAALVEFAIVASLLVTLVLGTIEIGMAWNDSQLVIQASRSGARVAAQLGQDPNADLRTLEAIEAGLDQLGTGVQRIVVFDASVGDAPTAACQGSGHPGVAGSCSVYDQGHFTSFNQGAWLPNSRNNNIDDADLVGVYLELERPLQTGFFGGTEMTLEETTIMRVEPSLETD